MHANHCEQLMRSERIPLISGRVQIDYRCTICGHRQREIRNVGGSLLSWQNITLHTRLAAEKSGSV